MPKNARRAFALTMAADLSLVACTGATPAATPASAGAPGAVATQPGATPTATTADPASLALRLFVLDLSDPQTVRYQLAVQGGP